MRAELAFLEKLAIITRNGEGKNAKKLVMKTSRPFTFERGEGKGLFFTRHYLVIVFRCQIIIFMFTLTVPHTRLNNIIFKFE